MGFKALPANTMAAKQGLRVFKVLQATQAAQGAVKVCGRFCGFVEKAKD